MSVLMRPTLFRHGNFKLLRYLGGTKNLEFRKLNHPRFIAVSSGDNNNNILDLIDLYPKSGPLGHNNHYVFKKSDLFQSLGLDQDECKEYFSGLLNSSGLNPRLLGRQCHGYLLKSGLLLNRDVKATLIRLYTMLSDVVGAMELMLLSNPPKLDTRSYNLILGVFIEKGYLDEALIILRRKLMLAEEEEEEDMVVWNKDTYIAIFGICARVKDLKLGRQVHNKLLRSYAIESDDDELSICNALIKMYGKCKEISSARKVFDTCETPPNVIVWTTILAAYLERGCFEMVLLGFIHMQRENVVPNEYSMFCILLTASAELFSLRCGNSLHALLVKTGFKGCKKLEDTLINMYSRAGDIKAAEKVFLDMTNYYYIRDTTTWNAMIKGYSLHGFGNKALALFYEMLELGKDVPNEETFVGVLSACGHTGLVDHGFYYLYKLMKQMRVKPGLEHYICIINMLIKAGRLNEALSFIVSTVAIKCDVFAWSTFLRGCHDHGNYALGVRAAELIPDDVASKVSGVRELMEIRDIEEEGGKSWMEFNIETNGYDPVHKGDPKFVKLHKVMKNFLGGFDLIINRYDTDIQDVLKRDRNGYHSEELVLADAISIYHRHYGSQINIIKASGKISGDCHTIMKLTSELLGNKLITVRDAYQFHNF